MLLDARDLADGQQLDTDVCVVGGGAAGIAIARELRGSGLDVVLLESGGLQDDPRTHQLYDGVFDGPFARKDYCLDSRCRYFGGTTNRWTGTCRPFDDIDFEARPWVELSGWPIRRRDLDDHYTRAAEVLDCAPFDEHRGDGQLVPFNIFSADGEPSRIAPKAMYRSRPIIRFGQKYRQELKSATDVRVLLHANLTELEPDADGRTVTRAQVAVLDGPRFGLRARTYVLATGGVENARLLLASNRVLPAGLGNDHGLVGRYYMDHARLKLVGHLAWTDPHYRKTLADGLRSGLLDRRPRWFYIMYTPSHTMQLDERMLNCGMTLRGRHETPIDPLTVEATRLAAAVDRTDGGRPLGREELETPFEAVKLYVEQTPNRASRVTLDEPVDALGMRRSRVEWRIKDSDVEQVFRSLELLGQELGRAARGRLRITIDRDTLFQEQGFLGSHPMGTTRMADRPERGVVDGDCRVHGLDNLFVAGSSVFPTGGFANPTLTLVALGLRLADHLKATAA